MQVAVEPEIRASSTGLSGVKVAPVSLQCALRPAFDKRPIGRLRFSLLEFISFDTFVQMCAELMLEGLSNQHGTPHKGRISFFQGAGT
jgi:hypothetical protein